MYNLNLLIKPASSICNIKCHYCFYCEEVDSREHKNFGLMSEKILEKIVERIFEKVKCSVNILFQGGEPLIMGVNFFYKFHEFVKKYNKNNIEVNFSIQTNGILINKAWSNFFKKNNYLVGVSLDGNKDTHDKFRRDKKNNGTFELVFENIKLLQKENVKYNIICVVSKIVSKNGRKIYEFFKKNKFRHYQFIPCLDSLTSDKPKDYTLDSSEYGEFLNEIFNLWYKDILNNKRISIRYFDNLIRIILGEEPEACDMCGHCNVNLVVETDGSIYPCDFYAYDEHKLGNIKTDNFSYLIKSDREINFLNSSLEYSENCLNCNYFKLCRGGCRRYKNKNLDNKFCKSYVFFFEKNLEKLVEVAVYIKKIRERGKL